MEDDKAEIARNAAAWLHVEAIRRNKFSICSKRSNPLTQDLQNAVSNLSSELYTKDIHFLMELIQNAEDNEYAPGVTPSLEFVMTTEDICGVGAPATLLVFNNEVGFSKANIESLCSVGQSTKKGRRCQGFIGEKGIGFKSVFLVTTQPHVFSNGFMIRFNEVPHPECGIGYIVPEWVGATPISSLVDNLCGTVEQKPTTTIILPLKAEKVEAVRKQLSELHPEVLLFLLKLKRLSVKEKISNPSTDSISSVSISSETNLISSVGQNASSRVLHLSVQEEAGKPDATCRYYIYKQALPVKAECVVESRKNLKEWVISLAFPFGERLKRGTSSVGVFAYLPTEMVTNFPFVIQADFMLSSSRESILLDNKWNLGILDCVSYSFVNAITTLIKSVSCAQLFTAAQILHFLPVKEPPFKELNKVRDSIRVQLHGKCIVPYESFIDEKIRFCKPSNAIRILEKFRKILLDVKNRRVLDWISSNGKFVLHGSVDQAEHDKVLEFLKVPCVQDSYPWYGKCIEACNLIFDAPTDVYIKLLCFLSDHHYIKFVNTVPLFKYLACNGEISTCSISQIKNGSINLHVVWGKEEHAWLNKWNKEMGCPNNIFFFPDAFISALTESGRHLQLEKWLRYNVGVVVTNVTGYCSSLVRIIRAKKNPRLVLLFAHFIYHSALRKFIDHTAVFDILQLMPVIDVHGEVKLSSRTLVPSSGSKWFDLFGSTVIFSSEIGSGSSSSVKLSKNNTDCEDMYVELGKVYAREAEFSGEVTPRKELLHFLEKHAKAFDLPHILPPNQALKIVSADLTSEKALMLLKWIRNLMEKTYFCSASRTTKKFEMPKRFIDSIRNGMWLNTYAGFKSPTKSYLVESMDYDLLKIGIFLQVVGGIDQAFYSYKIGSFSDVLLLLGVQVGNESMYQTITDHIKSLVCSLMSSGVAMEVLRLIKYSKVNQKLDEQFLKSVREGKWIKAYQSNTSPSQSVLLTLDIGKTISHITDLQVLDRSYYGEELGNFIDELRLLNVTVDVEEVYKVIPLHFRFPEDPSKLTKEAVLLLLKCLSDNGPGSDNLMLELKSRNWVKTTCGIRSPQECLLFEPEWQNLMGIVPLPTIDVDYYGNAIRSYKIELGKIGVIVDLDSTIKFVASKLQLLLCSTCLSSRAVISLLKCLRFVEESMPSKACHLLDFLLEKKWLKTSLGYKSPPGSILPDSKWATVSHLIELPLIEEDFYGSELFSFKKELKMLGVIVDFNQGARFVAKGFHLPAEASQLSAETVRSLLECVYSLRTSTEASDKSLLEHLVEKLRARKWLRTSKGYCCPEESLIFNPVWEGFLKEFDGPFLEQGFFGSFSSREVLSLKVLGVITSAAGVCSLIFKNLTTLCQSSQVLRILFFFKMSKWRPEVQNTSEIKVWIPHQDGKDKGEWVNSSECILHDSANLFRRCLHILDIYYPEDMLTYLSTAFHMPSSPGADNYISLWSYWVRSDHILSQQELSSYWEFMFQNWNSVPQAVINEVFVKLPASAKSGAIHLENKEDLFFPDDLLFKKLFSEAAERPLFVWLPQNASSHKLSIIYKNLGVRRISQSVESSVFSMFERLDSKKHLIEKPLIKIILAFLATLPVNMSQAEREKRAKFLLDISVFGTDEPVKVNYHLKLPLQGSKLIVEATRLVIWNKYLQALLLHKPSYETSHKDIEFSTDFARAIATAVLSDFTDHVDNLCKIIKIGAAYGFRESEVDYLLATENLELYPEDQKFLDLIFPVGNLMLLECHDAPQTPLKRQRQK